MSFFARTDQAGEAVQIMPKPAEVQKPLPAIPTKARNTAVAARTAPDRSGKYQIVLPKLLGNFMLMLQQVFRLALVEIRVKISARPAHRLLAADVLFAWLKNRDKLQIGRINESKLHILHHLPAVPPLVVLEETPSVYDYLNRVRHLLRVERSFPYSLEPVVLLPSKPAQRIVCDSCHDDSPFVLTTFRGRRTTACIINFFIKNVNVLKSLTEIGLNQSLLKVCFSADYRRQL